VPQVGPDLIRVQISIVYFFAAIWKINPHFLSGWVLGTYVREGIITLPESFYQPHILAGFALLAIATELLLAFGLWSARLRGPAAVVGVGLHMSFVLLMPQWAELIVFGLLAAGTYPLFLSRDGEGAAMKTASNSGETTMRTVRRAGPVLLAAMTVTACGDTRPGGEAGMLDRGGVRIVVVSHGQASDPFWSVVANGITDAADDLGVRVEYQAPVSFDMVRMSQMIDAAVASMPSALIITVPDADALGGAIRSAKAAGIPILSINSGAESWEALGLLAHIGQTEYEAAFAGGERLAAAGARRVLCVNHEVGNLAQDERCRGLADALQEAGGTSTVLTVDLADPDDAQQRVANALTGRTAVDGILTLGPAGAVPTLAALRATGRLAEVRFGSFDLEADVLTAVRDGEVLFVIDQQPYLQGYLGVTLMVKYLETAGIPGGGQIIRTGPGFVTRDDVDAVIRHARRGVR
jgi:simple sugar transport system substrate-binding protein